MEKLEEKLKLIGDVRVSSDEVIASVVDEITGGRAKILSFEGLKNHYFQTKLTKEDLLDKEIYLTYRYCSELLFKITKSGAITCKLTIWEGDNYDGRPTELRFWVEVAIDKKILKSIKSYIDEEFDDYLENEWVKYWNSRRKKWKQNMQKKLLEGK